MHCFVVVVSSGVLVRRGDCISMLQHQPDANGRTLRGEFLRIDEGKTKYRSKNEIPLVVRKPPRNLQRESS